MNRKLLFITLLILINSAFAIVSASVDRNQVELGQSLTLTISLPDSNASPDIAALQNNFEIYNTGTTSQTSIINGHSSSQTTFSATLIPKNQGKQQIPAIKVGNDSTAPITIDVIPPNRNEVDQALGSSNVLVTATASDLNPYVGVPVLLSVKLYFSVPVANLSMQPLNVASLKVQPEDKTIQYQARLNGKPYQVVEQKLTLTPSQSGEVKIPPIRINGTISDDQNQDLFGIVGSKPFMVLSKPLTLHVKAIPDGIDQTKWLPASNVNINQQWSIESQNIRQGEPITRTIVINAHGIPGSSIPDYTFISPESVNSYPDKPQSTTSTDNGDLIGTKTIKIAYIPTKAGKIYFPEITISWWDTKSGTLKSSKLEARNYNVLPSTSSSNQQITTANIVPNLSTGVTKPSTSNISNSFTKPYLWIYLTLIFASLWLITLIFTIRLYRQYRSNGKVRFIKDNSSKENNQPESLTKVLKELRLACDQQDTNKTKQALIDWANLHWQTKIYTISGIKQQQISDELSNLISEFELALYKGKQFTDYQALWQVIEKLNKLKQEKQPSRLNEFYPQ